MSSVRAGTLRSSYSGIGAMLAGASGGAVASFLGIVILARRLGAVEMGKYGVGIGLALAGAAISSQWLQQGVIRLLPFQLQVFGRTPPDHVRRILWGWLLPPVGLMIAVVSAVGLLAGYDSTLLVPSVMLLVGVATNGTWFAVLQASGLPRALAAVRLSDAVLRTGLAVAASIALGPQGELAIWGAAIGAWLALALTVAVVSATKAPDNARLKQELTLSVVARYGLPMVGWFICASYFASGDRVVLGALLGPTDLGAYVVMAGLAWGTAAVAVAPALSVVQPIMMRAWDDGRTTEARSLAGTGAEICIIATAVGSAGIVVGGETLIRALFGREYESYSIVAACLFATAMIWQSTLLLHKPLEFLGKTFLMFWLLGTGVGVALTVTLVFAPAFGAVGAACGLLCGVLTYAVAVVAASGKLRTNIRWRRVIRFAGPVSAVAVLQVVLFRPEGGSMTQRLATIFLWALASCVGMLGIARELRNDGM